MDVKTDPNNQATLPDAPNPEGVADQGGEKDHRGDPAADAAQDAAAVRAKLAVSGITERHIAGAIAWARRPKE